MFFALAVGRLTDTCLGSLLESWPDGKDLLVASDLGNLEQASDGLGLVFALSELRNL